jgi:hydroxylaminobenzene mutase
MDVSSTLSRQGHRLLQVGVALFLFTSFEGFAIPYFTVPLLGRSTHTLSALFGVILLTLGLVWPRLRLGLTASRVAFWFLIYSGFAIIAAFFLAGIWGAGKSVMPLSGAPLGSAFHETIVMAVAYSSAPTGIISFALILWGLRMTTSPAFGHILRSGPSNPTDRKEIRPMTQQVTITDVPVGEPVTMINAFTVPIDESEQFLQRWKDNAQVMAAQPGFIRTCMYQSLVSDAELRFVNIGEWDSGKALAKARGNPEWRASMQRMLDDPELHITPRPGVYQIAFDVHPGDALSQ